MGGRNKEVSFSVRREGNAAFYKCFRASCDARGVHRYTGGGSTQPLALPKPMERPRETRFRGHSYPIAKELIEYLKDEFGLMQRHLLTYPIFRTYDNKLILPIYNSLGVRVGEEIKNYPEVTDDHMAQKSRIYIEDTSPVLAWYRRRFVGGEMALDSKKTLLIVEDQISALKACGMCDTVALCGVNLSKDKVVTIGQMNYDRVILALDSDAFSIAVKSYQRAAALIHGLQIVRLAKDVKNMAYSEIYKLLYNTGEFTL